MTELKFNETYDALSDEDKVKVQEMAEQYKEFPYEALVASVVVMKTELIEAYKALDMHERLLEILVITSGLVPPEVLAEAGYTAPPAPVAEAAADSPQVFGTYL